MFPILNIAFIVFNAVILVNTADGFTLRKECPDEEIHRSCSFYTEYTCWKQADRMDRVRTLPKRLPHCRAGCYCKKGLVREFPHGRCIVAAGCQNRILQDVLKNLPTGRPFKTNCIFT